MKLIRFGTEMGASAPSDQDRKPVATYITKDGTNRILLASYGYIHKSPLHHGVIMPLDKNGKPIGKGQSIAQIEKNLPQAKQLTYELQLGQPMTPESMALLSKNLPKQLSGLKITAIDKRGEPYYPNPAI